MSTEGHDLGFDDEDLDEPAVDDGPEGPEVVECWCGARGAYEDLFDDDFLDDSCGGMLTVHCHCGGDLCVCHHHGETECPGCPDCEGLDDEPDVDLGREETAWVCGCGEFVDGDYHCGRCGGCQPWGCGMDHDEPEDDDEADMEDLWP